MQWVAYYANGTHLRQYDDAGVESKYADIDRTRLTSFALYDGGVEIKGVFAGNHDGSTINAANYHTATRKILHLHLEPGQRLIYRRRVQQSVGAEAPNVCYMIGWQQTSQGENIQAICYVFEDGTIEVAGRFNESHPWFYSPQAVTGEINE